MIRSVALASGSFDTDGCVNDWTTVPPNLQPDDDSLSTVSDVTLPETTLETCSPKVIAALERRSKADVYGQCHPIESDTLIAFKLDTFTTRLDAIPAAAKSAVVHAEQKCPKLLSNKFKLMFLRCECFNVEKAVGRYIRYWEKRLDVFGAGRAFQELTLVGNETRPIDLGAISILSRAKTQPEADERDMIYVHASKLAPKQYTHVEAIRCFWVVMHTLLHDEQVQQRGAIFVVNVAHFGSPQRDPRLAQLVTSAAMGCLPLRLSAGHMCHTTPYHWCLFQVVLLLAGDRLRKRVRTHGANVAVALERDFGIPRGCVPVHLGGDADVKTFAK